MTQTQILEGSDELPEDEVESPLLFGILAGRDNTMHQSLFSHEVPYTFGTSDDCDVKISHDHWPDDKRMKEPWFRLNCVCFPLFFSFFRIEDELLVFRAFGYIAREEE